MIFFEKSSLICTCMIILKLHFSLAEPALNWIEEIEPSFQIPTGAELSFVGNHDGAVVCRLNLASFTRKEDKFDVRYFDGNLCTHVVFSWFYINSQYKIIPSSNFRQLKAAEHLISNYPHLKILLEIALPHEKDTNGKLEFMNTLLNSSRPRSTFISNTKYTLTILRRLGFAGVHLEMDFYFYSEKRQFLDFSMQLKEEFQKEGFLITTEIEGHSIMRLKKYYDGTIGQICQIFDLTVVKGFNFQTDQEPPITGHNSPLYGSGLNKENIYDNLKYIIEEEKADPNSLVLGIPLYGRPYNLQMSEDVSPFGFNKEIHAEKPFQLKTMLGYNKICKTALSKSEPWKMFWDDKAKTSFISLRNVWMSFENPQSVYEKVISSTDLGIRGAMAYYIDFDDFLGSCSKTTFPILRTINYALSGAKLQSHKMENPSLALATLGWIALIVVTALIVLAVIAHKIGRKLKSDKFSENELMTFTRGIPALGENVGAETEGYINPDSLPYDSAYEIPNTNYEIDKSSIVSRGRFGIEYQGQVNSFPVCVKSAKSTSNTLYIQALLSELKLLIYLEKQENVVSLIGADTMELKSGFTYIFVESCPLGNLQSYLWTSGDKFFSLVENDTFSNKEISKDKDYKISTANLLLWSYQISSALDHLSRNKIIHGDLSTENVLLFKKDLAKVTNIGVCQKYRELCAKNNVKTKEPISWRWMAIESLIDQEFSIQSDVWSFGITLWQIFSLGETPYRNWKWMTQFPEMLKQNMRMQKPSHATTFLYNFMRECWKESPSERPKSENITAYFSKLRNEYLFENSHLLLDDGEKYMEESTV